MGVVESLFRLGVFGFQDRFAFDCCFFMYFFEWLLYGFGMKFFLLNHQDTLCCEPVRRILSAEMSYAP